MNYHKRRVTFILSKQIKYYTKKTFKLLLLIAIALLIIFFIFFSKYQLVCEVSIAGENIGYVKDKNVRSEEHTSELQSPS